MMLTIRAVRLLAEFFNLRAEAALRKLAAKPIQDVLGKVEEIFSYLKEFAESKDEEDRQYIEQLAQLNKAAVEMATRLLANLKTKNWPEAERAYVQLSRLIVKVKSMVESINETDHQILLDEQGRNIGLPVTQVIDELRSSVSFEYDKSGAIQANEQLRFVNPELYESEEQEMEDESGPGGPAEEPEFPEYEMVEEPEEQEDGFQEEVEQAGQKQRQKKLKKILLSPQERNMLNQKRRQGYKDRKRQDPAFVANEQQRMREYRNEVNEAMRMMRANPTTVIPLPQWIKNRKSKKYLERNKQRTAGYQEAYKRLKQYQMSDEELGKLRVKNPKLYEEAVRNRIAINLAKERDPDTFAGLQRMANVWKQKLDYIAKWKKEKKEKARG